MIHYKPVPYTPRSILHIKRNLPGALVRIRIFKQTRFRNYPGNTVYFSNRVENFNLALFNWEGIIRIQPTTGPELHKGKVWLGFKRVNQNLKVAI